MHKRGPIWRALRPLLGHSVITADADHAHMRAQLGNALGKLTGWAEAVNGYPLPAVGERFDLLSVVSDWIEQVILTVLFESPRSRHIGRYIRGAVALAPLRLLGIPADFWHLRKLDRALAELPRPSWMPEDANVRDWLATFYVAAYETTYKRVSGRLCGDATVPIAFVPRQDDRGRNVIILLDERSMFGVGARKCIGEQIARQIEALCLQRLQVRVLRANLRKRGVFTRGLTSAFVERVR